MIKDLIITSLETITAFNVTSGAYLFTLDELQNASINNTEEKSDVTGKAGRRLDTLKRNKAVTISGTSGVISGGLLEAQTGSTFTNAAVEVMWTDYLTVNSSHEATTTYKAIGTTGAEIVGLYIRNDDGTAGTQLTQDSAAAAGKFAYAPATKKLTFHTDVANGTEVIVYYKRKITADSIANKSDSFSEKATLYIDALAEDKCSNVYRVQFFVPKADFNGEFEFGMSGDQTVHAFSADALAGACGTDGSFWTFTVFGVNTADAA